MNYTLEQLQKRISENNQEAYSLLFKTYYDRLNRFAFVLTKDKQLSEEIVSDVFIKIWKRRDHIQEIKNLNLYLFISIRNTALNYLKKLSRIQFEPIDNLESEPSIPFADPEQALITKEMNERLVSAIQALPPRCKLVFSMIRENGLSYRETAELLNLSVSTVDNQLVNALKSISRSLVYRFQKKEKKY